MAFPEAKLKALEEKISHPRWVVPVLPEEELEALLIAATDLAMKGEDNNHPACQRFYNDSLTVSFTKILTDDIVSSWRKYIQQCVLSNCEKLVKLCAMKLDDARFLHLLSMAFNLNNKFHTYNATRTCEGLSVTTSTTSSAPGSAQEPVVFARSLDHCTPRGWLVHLINVFGEAGGFTKIRERFDAIMGFQKPDLTSSVNSEEKVSTKIIEKDSEESKVIKVDAIESISTISEGSECSTPAQSEQPSSLELSVSGETRVATIWQLLRPLGLCHDLLSPHTVTTYLFPLLGGREGLSK